MVKELDADKPLTKAQKRQKATGRKGVTRPPRQMIPVLPKNVVDVSKLESPSQRAVACVNLKLHGASFQAIADELSYADARAAETAYIAALATMHPVESWETLRQTEAARAELGIMLAASMATADYLVDANDPKRRIPNTEKRLWHDQYLKALALHATITGAKAPTRVEVSATVQELNAMTQDILQGAPTQIREGSIWQIQEIEPEAEEGGE